MLSLLDEATGRRAAGGGFAPDPDAFAGAFEPLAELAEPCEAGFAA